MRRGTIDRARGGAFFAGGAGEFRREGQEAVLLQRRGERRAGVAIDKGGVGHREIGELILLHLEDVAHAAGRMGEKGEHAVARIEPQQQHRLQRRLGHPDFPECGRQDGHRSAHRKQRLGAEVRPLGKEEMRGVAAVEMRRVGRLRIAVNDLAGAEREPVHVALMAEHDRMAGRARRRCEGTLHLRDVGTDRGGEVAQSQEAAMRDHIERETVELDLREDTRGEPVRRNCSCGMR